MRLVWDSSALVAMVRIDDPHHEAANGVWKENEECVSIFPSLAWFEFQGDCQSASAILPRR
jgi:hypothetical protein